MHIVIESYRTRDVDDAHAVVGREATEAADLDDVPWKSPDDFRKHLSCRNDPTPTTIIDAVGSVLYAGAIEADASNEGR